MRCECPSKAEGGLGEFWYEPEEYKAMIHEPNECPGDYQVKQYIRAGELITLCSACCMPQDQEITEEVDQNAQVS